MYANLTVGIGERGSERYEEEVYAWAVTVDGTKATVHLDAADGLGSYAEPDGERVVDLTTHEISIGANF